jgi:hypothetical protein
MFVPCIARRSINSLMFVPCIARRSINNQHYALIYITSLFNVQAPTCFGSSLPSSGGLLDPCGLLEQIGGIVLWFPAGSYTTYLFCISNNSHGSKNLRDDGRLLPKHVGACILNTEVIQFST